MNDRSWPRRSGKRGPGSPGPRPGGDRADLGEVGTAVETVRYFDIFIANVGASQYPTGLVLAEKDSVDFSSSEPEPLWGSLIRHGVNRG